MRKRIESFKKFKGPKGKDLTVFVRFGGLDLKRQRGYGETTFHAPPASRGFYAFPKSMQELFLVGSLNSYQPGTYPKEPDWNSLSDEEYDKTIEEYNKRREKIFHNIRKEFRKDTGNIWHHLGEFCKRNEILDEHGSWVKTSISTWQKAFSKSSLKNRYGEDWAPQGFVRGRGEQSINAARGLSGYYSKDHYEVFFDEKV